MRGLVGEDPQLGQASGDPPPALCRLGEPRLVARPGGAAPPRPPTGRPGPGRMLGTPPAPPGR
eukprot:5745195-Lingulodinium_polyedra.AAC.1